MRQKNAPALDPAKHVDIIVTGPAGAGKSFLANILAAGLLSGDWCGTRDGNSMDHGGATLVDPGTGHSVTIRTLQDCSGDAVATLSASLGRAIANLPHDGNPFVFPDPRDPPMTEAELRHIAENPRVLFSYATVDQFIADQAATGATRVLGSVGDAYPNYVKWCTGMCCRPLPARRFASALAERGFEKVRKGNGRVYYVAPAPALTEIKRMPHVPAPFGLGRPSPRPALKVIAGGRRTAQRKGKADV